MYWAKYWKDLSFNFFIHKDKVKEDECYNKYLEERNKAVNKIVKDLESDLAKYDTALLRDICEHRLATQIEILQDIIRDKKEKQCK